MLIVHYFLSEEIPSLKMEGGIQPCFCLSEQKSSFIGMSPVRFLFFYSLNNSFMAPTSPVRFLKLTSNTKLQGSSAREEK